MPGKERGGALRRKSALQDEVLLQAGVPGLDLGGPEDSLGPHGFR